MVRARTIWAGLGDAGTVRKWRTVTLATTSFQKLAVVATHGSLKQADAPGRFMLTRHAPIRLSVRAKRKMPPLWGVKTITIPRSWLRKPPLWLGYRLQACPMLQSAIQNVR